MDRATDRGLSSRKKRWEDQAQNKRQKGRKRLRIRRMFTLHPAEATCCIAARTLLPELNSEEEVAHEIRVPGSFFIDKKSCREQHKSQTRESHKIPLSLESNWNFCGLTFSKFKPDISFSPSTAAIYEHNKQPQPNVARFGIWYI